MPEFVPPDSPEPEKFIPPDLPESKAGFGQILLSAAQGALLGFADEVSAADRALTERADDEDYLDAYRRIRDETRKGMAEFQEANPKAALASEVAGAFAVPSVGTAKLVSGGTTFVSRLLRGATAGAATGAVVGAGQAEELGDVPLEATESAVLGAGIGAVIPTAVSGAKAVSGAVRGGLTPARGSSQRIGQALRRDEITPQQIQGALEEAQKLGRPARAADVGGQALKRELEVAVQTPGAAAQVAQKFLSERNQEQLGRLSADFVKGTGIKASNVEEAIRQTMKTRAELARPVYARAMNFAAEADDDIVEAWRSAIKTPLGKQALGKARKILNVEDFNEAPLMEKIDAFKRGLDDVIEGSKRRGENFIARKALEVKNDLIGLVDAVNPDYKSARRIWENGSQYLDAADRGREILAPKFTAARVAQEFGDMTDAEQEAFRLGAVDAIVTRMRQQSAKQPNLIKLVRSPEMRDKLKAIMRPEQAARIGKILNIEDSMFSLASQARFGSQTAQRQAAQAEQAKQVGIMGLAEEITALVLTPARNFVVKKIPSLSRGARDRLLARQNAIIAKRLLSSDTRELLNVPTVQPSTITGGALIPPAVVATEQ